MCSVLIELWRCDLAFLFRNPEVHYRVYNSPQLVLILTWISQLQDLATNVLMVHFNIILLSTFRSSKWSLVLRFPQENPLYTSPLSKMCHMSRRPHCS